MDGLSSYPHPRLMPDFWEYPTVSMGIGPLNSIYQARFNKYLANRRLDDTDDSRVWCFIGDGECDEPETLGSISLATREQLDNLTWVINCNLQRLDGPVRGTARSSRSSRPSSEVRAGTSSRSIWGGAWDALLAKDKDGVLLNKMNETVDGDFQRYAVESGAYIREHFFGPDPRLREMVEHLSDDELRTLPRGGHDYRKLYAAYEMATEAKGGPTVILAKTIKGWTLGPDVEGRNATHQIKKMTNAQLRELRTRLRLDEEIPEALLTDGNTPPYIHFEEGSRELEYIRTRRTALDGPFPSRPAKLRRPITGPSERAVRRGVRGLGHAGGVDHHGVHPAAEKPAARRGLRVEGGPDHPRRGSDLRHGLDVP